MFGSVRFKRWRRLNRAKISGLEGPNFMGKILKTQEQNQNPDLLAKEIRLQRQFHQSIQFGFSKGWACSYQ